MQTTNPPVFRVIVKENNRILRSFAVFPQGKEMVAVSPRTLRTGQGPIEAFGWKEYDLLIGGVRYRIIGQEGKDFVVVPWVEEMG